MPLDPPRPVAERPEGPSPSTGDRPRRGRAAQRPGPAWRAGPPAITAPVVVLAGGPAGHGPQDRPAGLAEAVPDARLVTVEAGHLVHETRPAAFLAAIGEFGTG
ncbi:alpha/beta fold hydrolase [Streptomyces hydrogenans]